MMRRILFAGGGTLGSVTPLLATYEALQERRGVDQVSALWIGTRSGPERALVSEYGISFVSIFSGKWRRYLSPQNFFDPVLLCIGIVQAAFHIMRFRPDVIVHAGSSVGVPAILAGSLLGKKCMILQLDVKPSISNIICSGFVDRIGVSCAQSGQWYNKRKVRVIGIPVRAYVHQAIRRLASPDARIRARAQWGLRGDRPLLLVLGGGTGAQAVNDLVVDSLDELTIHADVIHATGKGKQERPFKRLGTPGYAPVEFLSDRYAEALALCDLVVTRAGMGTLAEIVAVGKPAVIIPIPHSHQVDNAALFEKKRAAVYCSQEHLTPERFARQIRTLIRDPKASAEMAKHMATALPDNARTAIVDFLLS